MQLDDLWPFSFGGAIFDFDGTLAESLDVWRRVDDLFFARRGMTYNADYAQRLSLLGFDVLLVVPTGYQSIERYLTGRLPVEHQVGPYRFDVAMPDFATLPMPRNGFMAWVGNLLKRGNQP